MTTTDNKDFLIGTLAYALYWMDESLQASLEAAGWPRMNRTRSMIMLSVTVGVNRPTALAKSLGVSRQAVHQLLRDMGEEGLVELVPDSKDRRAKIVQFSPGADAIRAAAENAVAAIEERLAERIGKQTLKQLKQGLNKDWGPIVVAPVDAN